MALFDTADISIVSNNTNCDNESFILQQMQVLKDAFLMNDAFM